MELYILDSDFQTVGVVDDASSIIWNSRFYTAGDFEIYIRADPDIIELLQPDRYVIRLESEEVGIISNRTITTDSEQGNYLTVTGGFLDSILKRRISWNQSTLSGNVEECIRQLLIENIIEPEDSNRTIENFILADKVGFTETLTDFDIQSTGDNLGDLISNICQQYKIGYKVLLSPENHFQFHLYRGTDRSYGQSENDYVVFSPEFDNLISSEYSYNRDEYKNAAIVVGEGEGADQKRVSLGDTAGLSRYESRIDGSSVSSNGEIISVETYMKMLTEYGKEQLGNSKIVEGLSGEVEYNTIYKPNEDYYLGDIVSVANEYGFQANTRIIEMLESEDETGYKITPTFDTWEVEQ